MDAGLDADLVAERAVMHGDPVAGRQRAVNDVALHVGMRGGRIGKALVIPKPVPAKKGWVWCPR